MDEDRTNIEEELEDTDCDCVILDDSINEDEAAAVDCDCVIVTPKKIKIEVAPVNDQYE